MINFVRQVCVPSILIFLISSTPLTLQNLSIKDSHAQSVKLTISTSQDPTQNNHFFGPQIVQIVIDDPGARDPDQSTSGLFVKSFPTQRVHLTNGLWHTFIAEDDSFLTFLDVMTDGIRDNRISVSNSDDTDNRNTVDSITIQFSQPDSFVREITELAGLLYIEVDKNDIFPSLPEPFSSAINPDVDINPSTEEEADWPYIILINIQETDIVDIRVGSVSASITFDDFSDAIQMNLDRDSYPVDSEIITTFKDFMWNINPVEEDVARFVLDKDTGRPAKVIYQPLRGFDPASTGINQGAGIGENLQDILPVFANLGFDERQLVEVDGVRNLKYKEVFDSGDNVFEEFAELFGRLVEDFTEADQLPTITFIEKDPNVSSFETVDEREGSRTKVFAGKRDTTASFDYFDIIDTAVIGVHDAFTSVDKEVYDSGDRATFTVTDPDLNTRSNVSEEPDGIQSKAFVIVGSPFPLTNNAAFTTLPKDPSTETFSSDSIKEVLFQSGTSMNAEETVNLAGVVDFFSLPNHSDDLNPSETDFLALDFTTDSTSGTSGASPTGFIVNTNVKLTDIDDVIMFTMTKAELQEKADPFILAVSKLTDKTNLGTSFSAAPLTDVFEVEFPKFNLIHVNLQKIEGTFARVFVEIAALDGVNEVAGSAQIVDFQPFDADDVDGNPFTQSIQPLIGNSGVGSFRVLDLIASLPPANLNNIALKFSVVLTDSANTPLPLTAARHQAVMDIIGLGVVRAEGADKDQIKLDAFENSVYRLELDEEGENTSRFTGRADFMTVLHDDTVQRILQNTVTIGDPLKIWFPNRFIPPNRLAFSYADVDVTGIFRQVSATFIYETKDGQVSWDREQYRFNQVAILTVTDEDLNRKPDAVEQYTIPQDGFMFFEFNKRRADTSCTVGTPNCFANNIEATLRETGPSTGVFKAQITMPEKVLLEDGDVIRAFKSDIEANYVDVRDTSSNVQQFDDRADIRSDIDTTPIEQEPEPELPTVMEKGSTRLEVNKSDFHPYDRVSITITSADKNVDVFRSDIIFISILRNSDKLGLSTYKLVETAINTGVFAGYIDLQGTRGKDGGVGPKDGNLNIKVGDSLNISFKTLFITTPIQYHQGEVFWDKTKYMIGEKAKMTVIDPDMNRNSDMTETVRVQLLIKNAKIHFDLRETSFNSGVFTGEAPFVDANKMVSATEIGVSIGDTVTMVYDDGTVPGTTGNNVIALKASVEISDVFELVGVNRVEHTEYKLVDEGGKEVNRPKFRGNYKIEGKVYNNTTQTLDFAFIVQIKDDDDGTTRFLKFVSNKLSPHGTVVPSLDWERLPRGKYTVEIFIWQNLDSPSALSSVKNISITVE
ncbi:MAG: hypothetical protein ACE5J2_04325 [Nitrososphaerales archaeon]